MSSFKNFRIPVQNILPLGIITGVLFAGSIANKYLGLWANEGVPPRHGMDVFEKMLLERDRRLVGDYIKQKDSLDVPSEFASNYKSYLIKM